MDLRKLLENTSFDGVMSVSDIHSNWKSANEAAVYAENNNLFTVYLGDLFDSEIDSHPSEVLRSVLKRVRAGKAAFTIGNHDDKYYRKAIGNPVVLKSVHEKTLSECGNVEHFLRDVRELVEHPNSDYYHTYDKWVYAHGAHHRSLWKGGKWTKETRSRALYGEVNGKRMPLTNKEVFRNMVGDFKNKYFNGKYERITGMPVRLYKWTTYIPIGYNVIVGHDRTPIDKKVPDGKPTIYRNRSGGTVYFTDTGSGKAPVGGPTGISSVVCLKEGDTLVFNHIEFFANL